MKILRSLLLLTLLIPDFEGADAPPRQPDNAMAEATLDLVFLGRDRPVRIELAITAGGQSLDRYWNRTFDQLMCFCDRNGDGVLDPDEANGLPSTKSLPQFLFSGVCLPGAQPAAWRELDQDGDGKVTRAELIHYYRNAGFGTALVGYSRMPGTRELNASLLRCLDADGDGKVSEEELKIAHQTLRKYDRNEDELISPSELVAELSYPGVTAGRLLTPAAAADASRSTPDLPMVILPRDRNAVARAGVLVRQRDRDHDQRLSLDESGLDRELFAKLDSNRDGWLTAEELSAWLESPADRIWRIAFDADLNRHPTIEDARNSGKSAPNAGGSQYLTTRRLLLTARADVGRLGIIHANAAGRYRTLFQEDNKDAGAGLKPLRAWIAGNKVPGPGSVDPARWLDLQKQIAGGCILVTFLDAGQGLFEVLDTDHDGALSVRELRSVFGRLHDCGCVRDGFLHVENLPETLFATISRGQPLAYIGKPNRCGPAWFQAMDRNGDGDVSRREWLGRLEDFARLDINSDGLLSPQEAERAASKH